MNLSCIYKSAIAFFLFLHSISIHAIPIVSDEQGWISELGRNNGNRGDNTYTGLEYGIGYRSWAGFDLSGLSGAVTSASILLRTTVSGWGDPDTPGIENLLEIYDLNGRPFGVSGFLDAGSGVLYGTEILVSSTVTSIALSTAALADLTKALGGRFYVGFKAPQLEAGTGNFGFYTTGLRSYPYPYPELELVVVPVANTSSVFMLSIFFLYLNRKRSNTNLRQMQV